MGKVANVAGCLLATAALCLAQEPGPSPNGQPPSILLIVVDTLRADRLGCYGYARPTSRVLDEFARTATRYTRAKAPAAWTLPSHASLFTGKYAFEHGAHETLLEAPQGKRLSFHPELSVTHNTLAMFLHGHGYQTCAFVANAAGLDPRFKLNRGFRTYQVCASDANKKLIPKGDAPQVNQEFLHWLDGECDKGPWFAFINYMDTHVPYRCAPRDGLPVAPPEPIQYLSIQEAMRPQSVGSNSTRRLLAQLNRQYDLAVGNVDEDLGRLFKELQRRDLWDGLLVIITSDHGEYLGEHDYVGHKRGLHEAVLAVPLLVKHPGQRQGRLDERLVSLVDVPRLIGDAVPDLAGDARRSFPYAIGDHAVIAEDYYRKRTPLVAGKKSPTPRVYRCVYEDRYKLIMEDDAALSLFDLSNDPGERSDLSARDLSRVTAMIARLKSLIAEKGVFTDVRAVEEPDDAGRARLKTLGYLGDE